MNEEKKLLLNTQISVKQFAYSLGYEDEYYFSRLFKKLAEVSQKQFRKSAKH